MLVDNDDDDHLSGARELEADLPTFDAALARSMRQIVQSAQSRVIDDQVISFNYFCDEAKINMSEISIGRYCRATS